MIAKGFGYPRIEFNSIFNLVLDSQNKAEAKKFPRGHVELQYQQATQKQKKPGINCNLNRAEMIDFILRCAASQHGSSLTKQLAEEFILKIIQPVVN